VPNPAIAYAWNPGFGTKFADPSTPPTGSCGAVKFSLDGKQVVFGHNNAPYVTAYAWSNGFGAKYADPATNPGGTVFGIAFSPDQKTIVLTSQGTNKVDAYAWGPGFGTKYANPTTIPFGVTGNGAVFSPSGDVLVVAATASTNQCGGKCKCGIAPTRTRWSGKKPSMSHFL
jgi:WD40 repeat protein